MCHLFFFFKKTNCLSIYSSSIFLLMVLFAPLWALSLRFLSEKCVMGRYCVINLEFSRVNLGTKTFNGPGCLGFMPKGLQTDELFYVSENSLLCPFGWDRNSGHVCVFLEQLSQQWLPVMASIPATSLTYCRIVWSTSMPTISLHALKKNDKTVNISPTILFIFLILPKTTCPMLLS